MTDTKGQAYGQQIKIYCMTTYYEHERLHCMNLDIFLLERLL
jgi:hypothetical protein